jgi:hypothetical protein
MAQVIMKSKDIKKSLIHLSLRIKAAIDWIDSGPAREMTLEVPDPFGHAKWQPGGPPCFLPETQDDCGNIGVLMGVVVAMPRNPTRGSGATKRAPRRK